MERDYSDFQADAAPVTGDTTTPRIFGILNIIFSLLAACIAAYSLMMSLFMPAMFESIEQSQQAAQESTAAEIHVLKEKEASATSEEEKTKIGDEIVVLESTMETEEVNPFAAMKDSRVHAYGIVDGATGLFFNLLMFISGVGLLLCKEWARKLAVWTAGLKILRLIGLQAVNIAVIIPIRMKQMQEMFVQMEMGDQGVGVNEMAGMQGVMFTAWAIVLLVGGSIYPALSLWFLTRPRVKAACQARAEEFLAG